ncbi:uncharacterized protein LOC121874354 isoform X2 [Homarus americanus]|nr:uncharacterized protein LOC121874354 isoform X2 [Homarus americanus]
MQVPPKVQAGKTVQLGCEFDLEGNSLYSLNWWRGSDQFYQFSPSSPDQIIVYKSPGITVDVKQSGKNVVVLRNISHDSAGRYKCEVLADYPSFEKVSETAKMEVIDVPTRPPNLALSRLQWSPGEVLEANCTSPGVRPPSNLYWYINGDKISPQHSRLVSPGVRTRMETGMNSLSQMSELKLVLRENHFIHGGQATLSCAASLQDAYHKPTEVYLALPGFKTAAPSQKLYGSARRLGSGITPLVVATLLSLTVLVL